MISLNVASMLPVARRLAKLLNARGVKTWMCTEMDGGVDFRKEISAAVKQCTVFVPLINEAWATSAECEFEYNFALRLNLTSKAKPRLPVVIPICFPDLNWTGHDHVMMLMASTNALVYSPEQEAVVFGRLADAMKLVGVKFRGVNPSSWDTLAVADWMQGPPHPHYALRIILHCSAFPPASPPSGDTLVCNFPCL